MRKINKEGLNLVKSFEGLRLKAYLDIVGVPTIGYGCTHGVTKEDVARGRSITEQEAVDMLMTELAKFEAGVEGCVTIPINDNQFSALVSFSYNVGTSALQKSTLLRLLNAGDVPGAAGQFARWNKAGGKEVAGLTRRRLAEQTLFLKADAPKEESPKEELLPPEPTDKEIEDKLKEIEKNLG
jgi:lysozyme